MECFENNKKIIKNVYLKFYHKMEIEEKSY